MMNDLTYAFERLIISMSQVYALLHFECHCFCAISHIGIR